MFYKQRVKTREGVHFLSFIGETCPGIRSKSDTDVIGTLSRTYHASVRYGGKISQLTEKQLPIIFVH